MFALPTPHFSIMIAEEQRLLLVDALTMASLSPLPAEKQEEAALLLKMLQELPEVEASSPGCLHGLCL